MPDSYKKSHPDEHYYLAAAEVNEDATPPDGMEKLTVPAGRYAKFVHRGSLGGLEKTMSYIFGAWLSKSGEELRIAPDLEVYDDRFNPLSEDSEFDIMIPIK